MLIDSSPLARKPAKRARVEMADYLTRPAFPPRPRKTEYDSYLSSDIDLELSVSSASLNLNSPPREHYMALTPDTEEPSAMDISPCPPPKPVMMTKPKLGRPRALTSSARLFGRDVSNDDVNTSGGSVFGDVKDTKLAPSPQITSSHIGSSRSDSLSAAKRLARPALPNQWFVPPAPSESEFSSPVSSSSSTKYTTQLSQLRYSLLCHLLPKMLMPWMSICIAISPTLLKTPLRFQRRPP